MKGAQAAAACVLSAVGVVLAVWWLSGTTDDPSAPSFQDPAESAVRPPLRAKDAVEGETPRSLDEAPAYGNRPDLVDLRSACGDSPWRLDVPDGCIDAMDSRYLDLVAVVVDPIDIGWETKSWAPLPTVDRATWREVFDDPEALRLAAANALEDPECRALAAAQTDPEIAFARDNYRHDLSERCNADAIARLSALHSACVTPLAYGDDWNWDESWAELFGDPGEEAPDHAGYWRLRSALEEAWFALGWRVQKCRAVPHRAMADLLGGYPPNGPNGEWLQLLASRLGSEWANARHYAALVPESAACTDEPDRNLDALAEWHLPLAHAALARCYERGDVRHVAHLLAAQRHDQDGRIDWTGWGDRFTAGQIADAEAEARRVYELGWSAPYVP